MKRDGASVDPSRIFGLKSNKTVPPPIGEKWLPARDLLCNKSFRPLKNQRILSKIHEFSLFQKNSNFLKIIFGLFFKVISRFFKCEKNFHNE